MTALAQCTASGVREAVMNEIAADWGGWCSISMAIKQCRSWRRCAFSRLACRYRALCDAFARAGMVEDAVGSPCDGLDERWKSCVATRFAVSARWRRHWMRLLRLVVDKDGS
jgi:hypothetical protein